MSSSISGTIGTVTFNGVEHRISSWSVEPGDGSLSVVVSTEKNKCHLDVFDLLNPDDERVIAAKNHTANLHNTIRDLEKSIDIKQDCINSLQERLREAEFGKQSCRWPSPDGGFYLGRHKDDWGCDYDLWAKFLPGTGGLCTACTYQDMPKSNFSWWSKYFPVSRECGAITEARSRVNAIIE